MLFADFGYYMEDHLEMFVALKYSDNFERTLIASINHNGVCNSTGAITGNILDAYLGVAAIPDKYIKNLNLSNVTTQIADDLYTGAASAEDALK